MTKKLMIYSGGINNLSEKVWKNQKGIFPSVSLMPKDNHSLMQLYLDGPRKNFFTFFGVNERTSNKIISSTILQSHNFINIKNLAKY